MAGRTQAAGAAAKQVRIKLPGLAYLPVLLLALCVTAVVQHPLAAFVYVVPVLALFYVVRTATIVDASGLTARALLGSKHVDWDELRGFSTDDRGRVYAARTDGTVLRLPCARARHLALIALVSEGRLTSPTASQ